MFGLPKLVLSVLSGAIVGGLLLFIGSEFGFRSGGFAFLLNWMVMSWVAFLGGALKVSIPIPDGYFVIRGWESSGRFYSLLGVRLFKRLLVRGPFSGLNSKIHYSGDRSSLKQLLGPMRDAEAAHLLVFLIVALAAGYAGVMGWWDLVVQLLSLNILLNIYPIMVQRLNRARLDRILRESGGLVAKEFC